MVDTVKVGEPCVSAGCGPDFYIGHEALSADDNGHLVFLYDGAVTELGPQRIYVRTSSDEGNLEHTDGPLGRRRERDHTGDGAGRERRRASVVHADEQR